MSVDESAGTAVGGTALSRTSTSARVGAAAPVRMVHLGLGNFFRAHQAWYTATAPDAPEWGIAAFTGRSAGLAEALTAQGGLYTLITRAADGDDAEIIGSISRAHPGPDTTALVNYLGDPRVAVVTLTVTEAGYLRGPDGHLTRNADVESDLASLRESEAPPLRTTAARLVAGLRRRRVAGAGPLALVPCDNVPDNGHALAVVVADFAEALDDDLATWIDHHVSFVTTMVDRITPATTDSDAPTAALLTGLVDAVPVVTEPFSEWVLAGDFPAGRPAWEQAGATFVEDISPFEQRKLWLLNGGHSLLAYAASPRGHETIAEAMSDPVCREWLEQWWAEAMRHLTLPMDQNAAYRRALITRFGNPAIRHLLAQIASDGSQKLPVRVIPVARSERAAGRLPLGATRIIAAWVNHLRGAGAPVKDTAADVVLPLAAGSLEDAVPALLGYLDSELGADTDLRAAVVGCCEELLAAAENLGAGAVG